MSSPPKDLWEDPKEAKLPFLIKELRNELLLPSTDAIEKLLNKR
jgi:hypothetical protein